MARAYLFVFMMFSSPLLMAANSPFFMALKVGLVDHSDDITDAAINTAIDISYLHNRYLATEFEISQTMIEGKTINNNNWSADSWSIFAALRTSGRVKLKVKIGLSDIQGGNDMTLATGFGVSYWSMGGLAEIELTRLDDNVSFLSFGVNFFY